MKRFFQGPIVFAAALLFTASGFALPKGGKCIKGSAKTHSSKKGLEITTDHNTWMDWDSFSIGKGEKVAFKMPNAKSCTINRVQGKTPSDIQGRLEANGSVYLLNRNGILIGKEAVINAASFLASTLDLVSDEVFAKDELLFRLGKEKGIITNYGMIETTAGSVTLLGYHVSNHGTVKAGSGKVFLGGGEEILLRPDEGILIRPSLEDLDTGVDNQGTIEALEVYLSSYQKDPGALAVNNGGLIHASSVITEGGKIRLVAAAGKVQNDGVLQATNVSGKGGDIHLLGDHVVVGQESRMDVSGAYGGGQILVGGDFQGKNSAIQNSEMTWVAKGAELCADALKEGNGGRLIIWSDGKTASAGDLSARGGSEGGNGGLIEISGRKFLASPKGKKDLSAPKGKIGTLLLDPCDVTISTAATAFMDMSGTPWFPTGTGAIIDTVDLVSALGAASGIGADVVITTTSGACSEDGVITVSDDISWPGLGALTLESPHPNGRIDIFAEIRRTDTLTPISTDVFIFNAPTINIGGPSASGALLAQTELGGISVTASKSLTIQGQTGSPFNFTFLQATNGSVDISAGEVAIDGVDLGGAIIIGGGTPTKSFSVRMNVTDGDLSMGTIPGRRFERITGNEDVIINIEKGNLVMTPQPAPGNTGGAVIESQLGSLTVTLQNQNGTGGRVDMVASTGINNQVSLRSAQKTTVTTDDDIFLQAGGATGALQGVSIEGSTGVEISARNLTILSGDVGDDTLISSDTSGILDIQLNKDGSGVGGDLMVSGATGGDARIVADGSASINIQASNVSLMGSSSTSGSSAQIASIGSGDVTILATDNMSLAGGTATDTPAFVQSASGNIAVGCRNLSLQGSASSGGFAGIDSLGGNLSANVSGNVTMQGGNAANSEVYLRTVSGDLSLTGFQSLSMLGNHEAIIQGNGNLVVNGGNITLNTAGSNPAFIENLSSSANTEITSTENVSLQGTSYIRAQGGILTVIAGADINVGSQAEVSNQGANGELNLVVDNRFPTVPDIGPGSFILASGGLVETASGSNLRIFTGSRSNNQILELLNGEAFVPGPLFVNSGQERWGTYYPSTFFGGPGFTLFYKQLEMSQLQSLVTKLAVAVSQINNSLSHLNPLYLYNRWFSFSVYGRFFTAFSTDQKEDSQEKKWMNQEEYFTSWEMPLSFPTPVNL